MNVRPEHLSVRARAETAVPVNYRDPEGLQRQAPYCWSVPGWGAEGWVLGMYVACDNWGEGAGGGSAGPPAESPGPEPAPARPVDAPTSAAARKLLNDRLKGFAGSNCDKVFGKVLDGYSVAGLTGKVGATEFYNVNSTGISGLSQNQVTGNGDGTTLKNSVPYGDTAKTIGGSLGSAVLLAANFFSNTNTTYQSNVLLHEILHTYPGMGDNEIFGAFQKYGLANVHGDSEDISAWLSTDCTKTPTSLTWWK